MITALCMHIATVEAEAGRPSRPPFEVTEAAMRWLGVLEHTPTPSTSRRATRPTSGGLGASARPSSPTSARTCASSCSVQSPRRAAERGPLRGRLDPDCGRRPLARRTPPPSSWSTSRTTTSPRTPCAPCTPSSASGPLPLRPRDRPRHLHRPPAVPRRQARPRRAPHPRLEPRLRPEGPAYLRLRRPLPRRGLVATVHAVRRLRGAPHSSPEVCPWAEARPMPPPHRLRRRVQPSP